MSLADIERGEENPAKEHDDKEEEEDLIKLLEQFSDRLGAVEKEILEPSGRNRRRRNVDERGPSTVVQVQEGVRSLQDEVHSQRRLRPPRRPKTSLHRAAQLMFLLLVAVLMYVYWNKISQRLPSLHWPIRSGGSKGHSWFERLHSTDAKRELVPKVGFEDAQQDGGTLGATLGGKLQGKDGMGTRTLKSIEVWKDGRTIEEAARDELEKQEDEMTRGDGVERRRRLLSRESRYVSLLRSQLC